MGTVFDPKIVGNLERHRPEFEQLMFALAKQTGISVDPDTIEQDVRHATGIAASAVHA